MQSVPRRLSGKDIVDDMAVDVGQSAIGAVVTEGESFMVDAH
jgi:hypothetical protein